MSGLDDVRAFVEQNKKPLAITGAAAVAGLALLSSRRSGGSSSSSSAPAPAAVPAAPYGGSATAIGGYAPGGSYSSTASDILAGLAPQLQAMSELQAKLTTPMPVPAAPKPQAASMFAPSYNGNYVWAPKNQTGSGPGVFEVQSDGSLFHFSADQWREAIARSGGAGKEKFTKLNEGWNGVWYTTTGNTEASSKGQTPTAFTLDPTGKVVKAGV